MTHQKHQRQDSEYNFPFCLHRFIVLPADLFLFFPFPLSLCLASFFLFFIREDGGFTLTQYAQVFPAAPRIGIRWSESLPVASSMIISNHRSKRTFQKSSRFLENKSDPDICLQISRRGLQSKRLHRLRG